MPGDGMEVVRKTASLPEERARLLREAEVLRTAWDRDVSGLATVVAWPSAEVDEPCLVTAGVAGPSLAVAAPLPAIEVAGAAAEVARILAELHQVGLVHGAVEPGHVVLDGGGGVILVGLGYGGTVGAPAEDPTAGPLDPADDVAGWGMLVSHLLDWSAAGEDEPLVALRRSLATRRVRRAGRRLPHPRPDEAERRVLAALADQAQDPDPARRPSARSLAVAVPHRIPAARVPGAVVATQPRRGPATGLLDRLSAHVAATAAAAGTAAPAVPADPPLESSPRPARTAGRPRSFGRRDPSLPPVRTDRHGASSRFGSLRRRGGADPVEARFSSAGEAADPAPPGQAADDLDLRARRPPQSGSRRLAWAGAAAALVVVAAPAVVARLRATEQPIGAAVAVPQPIGCPAAAPPAADVDGDGCEEPVRFADGVLQAGGARFALGAAGTAWTVGDWDCDGRRTLALLQGGGIAVFDTWPAPGAELRGRHVSAPPGASELAAVADPDGCERPALRRPGTADHVVDVARAP